MTFFNGREMELDDSSLGVISMISIELELLLSSVASVTSSLQAVTIAQINNA